MPHVYVLELAEGHYFIGRCEDSEDINEKIDDHLLGKTRDPHTDKYPVKRVDKIVRDVTPEGEIQCYTHYFQMYGMLNIHTDLNCYRCGRPGHYKKTCRTRWHRNDFEIEDEVDV
jgi:hypothetical protein